MCYLKYIYIYKSDSFCRKIISSTCLQQSIEYLPHLIVFFFRLGGLDLLSYVASNPEHDIFFALLDASTDEITCDSQFCTKAVMKRLSYSIGWRKAPLKHCEFLIIIIVKKCLFSVFADIFHWQIVTVNMFVL